MGRKRKTKWRRLSIGGTSGNEDEEIEADLEVLGFGKMNPGPIRGRSNSQPSHPIINYPSSSNQSNPTPTTSINGKYGNTSSSQTHHHSPPLSDPKSSDESTTSSGGGRMNTFNGDKSSGHGHYNGRGDHHHTGHNGYHHHHQPHYHHHHGGYYNGGKEGREGGYHHPSTTTTNGYHHHSNHNYYNGGNTNGGSGYYHHRSHSYNSGSGGSYHHHHHRGAGGSSSSYEGMGYRGGGRGGGSDYHHLSRFGGRFRKPRPYASYYYNNGPSSTHSSSNEEGGNNRPSYNQEEYTKITTPRQDVLLKKGYLSQRKPVTQSGSIDSSTTSGPNTPSTNGTPDTHSTNGINSDYSENGYENGETEGGTGGSSSYDETLYYGPPQPETAVFTDPTTGQIYYGQSNGEYFDAYPLSQVMVGGFPGPVYYSVPYPVAGIDWNGVPIYPIVPLGPPPQILEDTSTGNGIITTIVTTPTSPTTSSITQVEGNLEKRENPVGDNGNTSPKGDTIKISSKKSEHFHQHHHHTIPTTYYPTSSSTTTTSNPRNSKIKKNGKHFEGGVEIFSDSSNSSRHGSSTSNFSSSAPSTPLSPPGGGLTSSMAALCLTEPPPPLLVAHTIPPPPQPQHYSHLHHPPPFPNHHHRHHHPPHPQPFIYHPHHHPAAPPPTFVFAPPIYNGVVVPPPIPSSPPPDSSSTATNRKKRKVRLRRKKDGEDEVGQLTDESSSGTETEPEDLTIDPTITTTSTIINLDEKEVIEVTTVEGPNCTLASSTTTLSSSSSSLETSPDRARRKDLGTKSTQPSPCHVTIKPEVTTVPLGDKEDKVDNPPPPDPPTSEDSSQTTPDSDSTKNPDPPPPPPPPGDQSQSKKPHSLNLGSTFGIIEDDLLKSPSSPDSLNTTQSLAGSSDIPSATSISDTTEFMNRTTSVDEVDEELPPEGFLDQSEIKCISKQIEPLKLGLDEIEPLPTSSYHSTEPINAPPRPYPLFDSRESSPIKPKSNSILPEITPSPETRFEKQLELPELNEAAQSISPDLLPSSYSQLLISSEVFAPIESALETNEAELLPQVPSVASTVPVLLTSELIVIESQPPETIEPKNPSPSPLQTSLLQPGRQLSITLAVAEWLKVQGDDALTPVNQLQEIFELQSEDDEDDEDLTETSEESDPQESQSASTPSNCVIQ